MTMPYDPNSDDPFAGIPDPYAVQSPPVRTLQPAPPNPFAGQQPVVEEIRMPSEGGLPVEETEAPPGQRQLCERDGTPMHRAGSRISGTGHRLQAWACPFCGHVTTKPNFTFQGMQVY